MVVCGCGVSWRVYFSLQHILEKLREIAINPVTLKFFINCQLFPSYVCFSNIFLSFSVGCFLQYYLHSSYMLFIVPVCFSCSYSLFSKNLLPDTVRRIYWPILPLLQSSISILVFLYNKYMQLQFLSTLPHPQCGCLKMPMCRKP